MGFFTVSTDKESVKSNTGNSKFINKGGMYPIIIKAVIADMTANGSQHVNLWFEYEGQEQLIFNAIRLTNNDGTKNLNADVFNWLAVVCGLPDGKEIDDPVAQMLPIGKGGEEKECMVLTEFTGIPVHMRVQMQYTKWQETIRENKIIRNFFRYEDKASAEEIVNNAEFGKQYAFEETIVDKISLRDGLIQEEVEDFLKNRTFGNKNKATENKPAVTTPTRRFGIKKD